MRAVRRVVTAVMCAGMVACGGGGGGSVVIAAAPKLADICSTLDSYVTSDASGAGKVTGYSFLLYKQGTSLLSCSGGDQTLGSVKAIASATKLASAAAIMTLVDKGSLNLDLPIAIYLLGSGVSWPLDKAAITMRMLLAHTSGLPGLGPNDTQPACVDDPTGTTLEACVAAIAAAPLVAVPGLAFDYGGADYQVAGYVATQIAGQNWQDFFASAIGTPLGLGVFTYGNPQVVTNPRIAGGAFSNVADYQKILQMIQAGGTYNGTTVLSSSSVSEVETNQIVGRQVRYSPLNSTLYPGYGFGFFISSPSLYTGSPGPEFSDPGLYGTTPWIDNGLGYGAVLLISKNTATGLAMWDAVRPAIIDYMNQNP